MNFTIDQYFFMSVAKDLYDFQFKFLSETNENSFLQHI